MYLLWKIVSIILSVVSILSFLHNDYVQDIWYSSFNLFLNEFARG